MLFFAYGPLNAWMSGMGGEPDEHLVAATAWSGDRLQIVHSVLWILLLVFGWLLLRRLRSTTARLPAALNLVSGVLKQELLRHLRAGDRYRRGRCPARVARQSLGAIPQAISIRERPAEADDRAVPGHWEGDLIAGRHHSHIATLVERHSRFVLLVKVPDRSADTVAKALAHKIRRLPVELRRSLTWDRGSNENTNGLLRQHFPKGTDLAQHSQRHLDAVARQLNQRPRKTLGFKGPAETLAEVLR